MQTKYDFLIIGGGVFGLSAAIELRKRRFKVGLLNPDTLPHHLAASTDISKIVRMEYGSDQLYFDMADKAIEEWKDWNDLLGQELYHEIGLLMLMQQTIDHPSQDFEYQSMLHLQGRGYQTELLDASAISERYPAINPERYPHAHFNPIAGFVEAAEVIRAWTTYARGLGVQIIEQQSAQALKVEAGQLIAIISQTGERYQAGQTIICAGAFTPYLLPELQSQMKATGHPVFHLVPQNKAALTSAQLPVFTADISNSGWYGFPIHPKEGVVKMARHTNGLALHPAQSDRRVTDEEVLDLRVFLQQGFPMAQADPLVFTRRCLYTDTLDGHFWIDQHPEIKGLSVASGGSGHGMKMGPVLGTLIADMAEGKDHPWLSRFRWRNLSKDTLQKEEARFVVGGKLDL
jgi:glycine/D-amino acid oxidase-like deaminating enzyme